MSLHNTTPFGCLLSFLFLCAIVGVIQSVESKIVISILVSVCLTAAILAWLLKRHSDKNDPSNYHVTYVPNQPDLRQIGGIQSSSRYVTLTTPIYDLIKADLEKGENTQKYIAEQYSVSPKTVSSIKHGRILREELPEKEPKVRTENGFKWGDLVLKVFCLIGWVTIISVVGAFVALVMYLFGMWPEKRDEVAKARIANVVENSPMQAATSTESRLHDSGRAKLMQTDDGNAAVAQRKSSYDPAKRSRNTFLVSPDTGKELFEIDLVRKGTRLYERGTGKLVGLVLLDHGSNVEVTMQNMIHSRGGTVSVSTMTFSKSYVRSKYLTDR